MNVPTAQQPMQRTANQSKAATADCDIHPQRTGGKALHPYLSQHSIEHMCLFGSRRVRPFWPPGLSQRPAQRPPAAAPAVRSCSCANSFSMPTTAYWAS